ncbi:MAG: ribokinase [Anaerolineaceae bacterium]|nr:ribokinase [Anaerolineaceae bacterium]
MQALANIKPVDYLIIGNLTQDLTPQGYVLGGTAAYAALTAKALGLRVGLVTSCAAGLLLPELEGIQIVRYPSEYTTTFENLYTSSGRVQYLHKTAQLLTTGVTPECWKAAPIVHLGPVANEVAPALVESFPHSMVGLTLQGWLRGRGNDGRVSYNAWPQAYKTLKKVKAAVLSIEDVENNEHRIEELQAASSVLAVTEGAAGARVFWRGDQRRFRSPRVKEIDPVGAGDIFATAFFYRLHQTQDPWEAASFAVKLAATSVTRRGLQGIPTSSEVEACMVEIISRV